MFIFYQIHNIRGYRNDEEVSIYTEGTVLASSSMRNELDAEYMYEAINSILHLFNYD